MKKNNTKLILTACILSYVLAGVSLVLGICLGFNFFGLYNTLAEMLVNLGYEASSVETEIFIYTMELIIGGVVELYFANLYRKAYLPVFLPREFGKTLITLGILQILFASFIPAIFIIIAGVRVKNGKYAKAPIMEDGRSEACKKAGLSEFRMTAMSEAVNRLNELRNSGAISEEEYYANLNKILEG